MTIELHEWEQDHAKAIEMLRNVANVDAGGFFLVVVTDAGGKQFESGGMLSDKGLAPPHMIQMVAIILEQLSELSQIVLKEAVDLWIKDMRPDTESN